MKKKIIFSSITSLIFVFAFAFPVNAQVEPEANPLLSEACGLDIVLLLDMTGSIQSAGEVDTVKNAANDFVGTFLPSSPTTIGLVEFSDGSATVVQDLSDDKTDLESDIDGLSASGATNWEQAILLGTALLEGGADRDDAEHADLMIIITDGEPNEPGTDQEALDAAVAAANAAKTSSESMPIRIVAIGVAGPDIASLSVITGSNVDDDPITKDTDVITGDFDDLSDIFGELAAALCEDPGCDKCSGTEINIVHNHNVAMVQNNVSVSANTGNNFADGSYAGAGGKGGTIWNRRSGDVERSSTGNGGAGGNSGAGAYILTGNAHSSSSIANHVNYNQTDIELCPCENDCCVGECACSSLDLNMLNNRNQARVLNRNLSNANTGMNISLGSYSGSGGEGGGIKNGGEDVQDSQTGSGGTGGDSGPGAFVQTGSSLSRSDVVNRINVNVTRITR